MNLRYIRDDSMAKKMSKKRAARMTEWVGGTFEMAAYVTGEAEPYRPHSTVWMIPPDGPILGASVARGPDAATELASSLVVALERPMVPGFPIPTRLRVASKDLADAIRRAVPPGVEIVVAPTPEVDGVSASMSQHLRRGPARNRPPTYLESSFTKPEAVAHLFAGAAAMYRASPWRVFPSDAANFLIDIPSLGVSEHVVSIIGHMGESFGFLLFKSHAEFQKFYDLAHDAPRPATQVPAHVAINFERGADLAPNQRKEISQHGWEVAGPAAYPVVMSVEADLLARGPTSRECDIIDAACRAITMLASTIGALTRESLEGLPQRWDFKVQAREGEREVTMSAPLRSISSRP